MQLLLLVQANGLTLLALGHKQVCIRIAAEAQNGVVNKSHNSAITYDEQCRKSWAERAYAGDHRLDVNVESVALDEATLRSAKAT